MQSRTVFTAVSEKSPLRQLLIHPCFFSLNTLGFHNKYTPSSFPILFCLCLFRHLEKRSSGGGSFPASASLHRRIKDYVWGRNQMSRTRKAKKTWKAEGVNLTSVCLQMEIWKYINLSRKNLSSSMLRLIWIKESYFARCQDLMPLNNDTF